MYLELDVIPAKHLSRVRERDLVRRRNIDWCAIERDYRAGDLSLREMSRKHGCSHSTIANHAGRQGWKRAPAIAATASTSDDTRPTGRIA